MLHFKEAVSGCLQNDRKSKEMVYKSFYGYVMGVVLRYVGSRAEAEELVNDTFIKIFKGLGQFHFPENGESIAVFKGWCGRIAARTAIDHLRVRKSFSDLDVLGEAEQPISQDSPDARLHLEDILRLLSALPELQRMVFNLHEIEGYRHDEISSLLRIPASSCRTYLTRAKASLRHLYGQTSSDRYAK